MKFQTIVVLITVLISIIFLSLLFANVTQAATAEAARAACSLSIERQFFIEGDSSIVRKALNPYEIQCPRRIISTGEKETVVYAAALNHEHMRANTYTYAKKTDVGVTRETLDITKQESMYEALSYEMIECWDLFKQGSRDVLGPWFEIVAGNQCMVCAEFHTTQQTETKITFSELTNQEHHVLSQHGRLYPKLDDYLYGAPSPANPHICKREQHVGGEDVTFSQDNPLAVVYYRKGELGTGTSCQAVTVTPVRKLAEECRTII